MNRSVNAQRSVPSQSPVTPPRRTARPPLSPKNANGNLRRHHIPLRDAVTPNAQSLTQANARLIHERLQHNHDRLQVQLHGPAPSPLPAGAVKTFLDTTFRAYASRIQTEFTSLRAACARAVQREQHQNAQMRSTCARLTRERDVAEEKLRVLLDRRAAAASTGKRTRAEVEQEDEDSETGLLYPPSPVSPPQLPTQSPPPRLMSPFVLAVRRSPSHTPDPEDRTGFDLTVGGDSLPRPSKKRRVSASPECALATMSSTGEATAIMTKERQTCPAAGSGECDMDLESGSESDSSDSEATESSNSSNSGSRHSSRAASSSPPAAVESTAAFSPKRPTPSPPASPTRVHLPLDCVDIMYLPTDGKLVCRVCLLAVTSTSKTNASACSGPIKAFLPGAPWELLRTHCEEMHPEACRDVVGLGQAGVRELRRRLGLVQP
ncbi:hypothetical protein MVEN_02641600 [Mycena venus]|uniref:Uncharacterized protein n=1 Tax=Mycena venus TaxID=2733690 RepID=A0A8H6WRH5_9AGAR|nr:hypothetical protein MVEN_02641600 [Mycena venus]